MRGALPLDETLGPREKAGDLRSGGVAHLWLVDPNVRTLEMFEQQDGQWLLLETLTGNDPVGMPPFETISFSLGDLWPDGGLTADDETADGCGRQSWEQPS